MEGVHELPRRFSCDPSALSKSVLGHLQAQELPPTIDGHGELESIRIGIAIGDIQPVIAQDRAPLRSVGDVGDACGLGELDYQMAAADRHLRQRLRSATASDRASITPLSPPSAPVQMRLQSPPAKSI